LTENELVIKYPGAGDKDEVQKQINKVIGISWAADVLVCPLPQS
jgi:hypothetical protein